MFEWIKDDKARAFAYRTWNTIKVPLVAVLGVVVVTVILDVIEAGTVSIIASWTYWDSIVVVALKALAGILGIGVAAGGDKLVRMSK